jgi:hypothetical protein
LQQTSRDVPISTESQRRISEVYLRFHTEYKIKPYRQKWKEHHDRMTKENVYIINFIINNAYEYIRFAGSKIKAT